ncbi:MULTISPECIES: DUF3150 domain-containing protein [Enterobacterales]|jgi:hypothetical protein|uniref:DUF3150 domain-containing protein n=6 Tax=Morganellaceae TaxID=1903414 RepID=A0A899NI19_PROST|nr:MULTISPECIES: DUF3150 domain-containing protein [Enterobacterales]EKH6496421.1 DUF3150 domain-containing protein [Providencia rettgeri]ELL8907370.1 DUF3150 domain-containing protein [Proteus mirabilis]ELQ1457946.1 DUF3150 domain-containing protein [Providencia rettgeri]ELR5042650.1 DUF3150 domain-containing protein [Providencia rettgeri]ELR5053918.1 DUF3150 domain-containing protein [Providencia rettgeri]
MSTNNQTHTQVLDQLILVSLSEISCISGRKKLQRQDLGENAELPPEVMVSLGSKKVIDPQLINPFERFKNKAKKACLSYGVAFMGGYAVPTDKVNALIDELKDVKQEFYDYKKEFLKADFNGWINSFEEKYRAILVRDAAIDIGYMDSQIQFGFTAIHITPYGNAIIQDGFASQVKSLADEVYEDVASVADKFLKNLNSKDAISQHTLNPLRRSAEKLRTLAFIDPSVEGLCEYMSQVLDNLPLTGKVTGQDYNNALSLLNNLRDPQAAKSFVSLLSNPQADSGLDASLVLDASFELPTTDLVSPPAQPALETTPATPADVVPHTNAFAVAETIDDSFLADLPLDLPPAGPVADPVVTVADTSSTVEVNQPAGSVEVVDDSALLSSFVVPAAAVDLNAPASATPVNLDFADTDSDDGIMMF